MQKGSVGYLQAKSFDDSGGIRNDFTKDLAEESVQERHLLQDKDILLVAKWTRNFATLYSKEYWPCVASSTFFVIRLKSIESIIPEYLSIILNHSQNREYFQNNFSGSTIPSIPKSVLENFEFSIPPLEKQRLIIQLDTLHKKEVRLQNKLLEKKEQLINQIIFTSSHL